MKWFIRIFGVLGVFFLLFLIIQIFIPSQVNVTVEKEYKHSAKQLYKAFSNTKTFNSFNEWMRIDPKNTNVTYSSIKEGKGARYEWSNSININEVGSGSLDIVEANPYSFVKYEMRFGEDSEPGIGTITISEKKEITKVVWNFTGTEMPFMFRFINTIFNEVISDNMNKSLINLEESLKSNTLIEEELIEIQKETALTKFSKEKK